MRAVPPRTSPSAAAHPPSYSLQTPSLIPHSSRLSGYDASSSSSPPNDDLQTPRDGHNLDGSSTGRGGARGRGRLGKNDATSRRPVKVRGSSSSGALQSSPAFEPVEHKPILPPPPQPQLQRRGPTPVVAPNAAALQPPVPRPAASRSRTRPLPPRPAPPPTNHLSIAQAHGITPDQFEQAKLQVMRFLKTDAGGSASNAATGGLLSGFEERRTKGQGRGGSALPAGETRSASPAPIATAMNFGAVHATELAFGSVAFQPAHSHSAPPSSTIPQHEFSPPSLDASATARSQRPPFPHASISSPYLAHAQLPGSHPPLLGDPFVESRADSRVVRSRASLEDIADRTAERARMDEEERKGREVRKWAESDIPSGSSEEPEELVMDVVDEKARANNTPMKSPWGKMDSTLPSLSHAGLTPSGLLPSPSFARTTKGTPTSIGKGMMERFMEERRDLEESRPDSDSEEDMPLPTPQASTFSDLIQQQQSHYTQGQLSHLEDDEADSVTAAAAVLASVHSSPVRGSTAPRVALSPMGSPPANRVLGFSPNPNAMMTSPAPSRPHPSIFDSPEVDRLLKSELSEMHARGSPMSSPSKSGGELLGDDVFSSPFGASVRSIYGERDSSYSSGGAKRTRDVFATSDFDSTKRSRYQAPGDDGRVSPTPSNASASMRAPSFCDSSPAMSDRASTSGGQSSYHTIQSHPASAPDYYHLPSSSPSSANSDFSQPRHRSSPGPAPAVPQFVPQPPPPRPIVSASTSFSDVSSSSLSRKRPVKRADTSPAIMGSDGSYAKPSWSYAALIGQAIFSTEDRKISLADIYTFIMQCYPYYKKEDSGWQNSIRHNLSLNECFIKTARGADNPGKGCLWAIAAGCEDQFLDGGFTKKGGTTTTTRRGKKAASSGVPSSAASAARFDPLSGRKGSSGDSSPSSSRAGSPALSAASLSASKQSRPSRASLAATASIREPLPKSIREASPPPPPPPAAPAGPAPFLTGSTIVNHFDHSRSTRRDSISTLSSLSSIDEPLEKPAPKPEPQSQPVLAPPYVPRPAPSAPAPRRNAPPLRRSTTNPAVAASPPTSVYHRLAGPYQPISASQSDTNHHRALALLASPEAGGIMPVHPSVYERPVVMTMGMHAGSPTRGGFLPAPQIFPGGSSRRNVRDDNGEKEDGRRASMISPTSYVHTQSPVSSIRGGPRAPMSPVQTASDHAASSTSDPEKKRVMGARHLPAVAALADASETFRTPPRLRSPSSRSTASVGPGAKAWGTPYAGGRVGMSPGFAAAAGMSGGDGYSGWGDPFGGRAEVEAELERFWSLQETGEAGDDSPLAT
ncbi:hypothetical protein MNV49_004880 [Pseudohyphozyma bogoriensis]|nr:hypothetical protein MNV49_004880 [Pseudohyphozyma bogoriensis]